MDTSRRKDLERHGEARTIMGGLKKMGKSWKEVEKIAADRNQWMGLVYQPQVPPGAKRKGK